MRTVNSGGVPETGRGLDVVGWQPDGAAAAVVLHEQVALPADAATVCTRLVSVMIASTSTTA